MPLEPKSDGVDPDDEIPESPKGPPVTQPGDVWQLGDHVLYCGDCRGDLGKLMAGRTVNVAVTSPPYASQRKYDPASGFVPIAPDAYVEWFEAVQANVSRYLAPDGSWFVNIRAHCNDGQRSLYVYDLAIAHVRTWDWNLVDDYCWDKMQGVPGGWPNRFKNEWEPVFHFAKAGAIKFRPLHVAKYSERACVGNTDPSVGPAYKSQSGFDAGSIKDGPGLALPSNVIHAGCDVRQPHSAPFPVALPSFFIAAFSDEGDTIFEPFCGSGTTLVAAERLHRKCIAVEISPAYCDVIVERWQTLTGRAATRAAAGASAITSDSAPVAAATMPSHPRAPRPRARRTSVRP